MRFQIDGKTYAIEFQREFKKVPSGVVYMVDSKGDVVLDKHGEPMVKRNESGIPIVNLVPSKFPYTTVNIVEVGAKREDDKIFRTYTAGAYHKDNFTLEEGRRAALRGVTRTNSLPYEFKTAMWKAYMERKTK